MSFKSVDITFARTIIFHFGLFLMRVTSWVRGRRAVWIFEPFKPFSGALMVETCIKGGLPAVPRHFWLVQVQKCLGYFAFIGQFDSWEWRGTWGERERGRRAGHAWKASGQIQTRGAVATWSLPQTAGLLRPSQVAFNIHQWQRWLNWMVEC